MAVAFIFMSNKVWTSERGQDRDLGRSESQLGKQSDAAGRFPSMTESTRTTKKTKKKTSVSMFLNGSDSTITAFWPKTHCT